MPLIKSAKKSMRQTARRTERLLPYRSRMKTMVKKVLDCSREGKRDEAEKALPLAFKSVDLAVKKHIIHRKTGARRKSRMSRAVAGVGK